ncbi:MAG: hypothetical protein GY723_20050 [bacterium]|nr:hypothetical protein [bacterium]
MLMRPPGSLRTRAAGLVLGTMSVLALASASSATTIGYLATDLDDSLGPGGDYWEIAYTVSGFAFDEDQAFRIGFDADDYSDLFFTGLPAQPDWDVLTFQPIPFLSVPGALDSLALVGDASIADPFRVRFVWLGPGNPGPQPWSIDEYDSIGGFVGNLETGTTIPESGPAVLMGLGLLALRLLRSRSEGRLRSRSEGRLRSRSLWRSGAAPLTLLLFPLAAPQAAHAQFANPLEIIDTQLVGMQPIDRTHVLYTYSATVKNHNNVDYQNVTALPVTGAAPGVQVAPPNYQITFGDVAAGATAGSIESYSLIVDHALYSADFELLWLVSGTGNVTLAQNSVVVDDATRDALLSIDGDDLTFDTMTAQLAALVDGLSILIFPAVGSEVDPVLPDGLIGRVSSVAPDGGNVVVTLFSADVRDAVTDLTWGLSIHAQTMGEVGGEVVLPEPDPEQGIRTSGDCALQENGTRVSGPGGSAIVPDGTGGIAQCGAAHSGYAEPWGPIVLVPGEEEGDPPLLELNGSWRLLGPKIGLALQLKDGEVDFFRFDIIGQQALTATLRAEIEESFNEQQELVNLELAHFTINVGPVPIEIAIIFEMTGGTDGHFTGRSKISFVEEAEFAAGMTYQDGEWTPNVIANVDAGVSQPELEEATAHVNFWLIPRLHVLLERIGGPFVEGEAFIRADADALADPLWEISGGTELRGGVTVNPFGIELLAPSTVLLRDEKVLASGANPFPPNAVAITGDPGPSGTAAVPMNAPIDSGEPIRWSRVYPLAGNDKVRDLSLREDDNALIALERSVTNGGVLLEVDSIGDVVWQRQFPITHKVLAVEALSGGDTIVAGSIGLDFWVMRLDANRDPVWFKQLDPAGSIQRSELFLAEIPTGGDPDVLLASSYLPSAAESDVFATRLDAADGTVLWARHYGAAGSFEHVAEMRRLASGRFALAGETNDLLPAPPCSQNPGQTQNGYGLLLEEDGEIAHAETRGTSLLVDRFTSVADSASEEEPVQWGGYTRFTVLDTGSDLWLSPYRLGPQDDLIFPEIRALDDVDGGVIAAGKFGELGSEAAVMLRFATGPREDATDDRVAPGVGGIWWVTYNGPGSDMLEEVHEAEDGYLAAGISDSFGADDDLWLVRTGVDGFLNFLPHLDTTAAYGELKNEIEASRAVAEQCFDQIEHRKLHPTEWSAVAVTVDSTAIPNLTDPGTEPVELVKAPAPAAPAEAASLPARGGCGLGVELGPALALLRLVRRRSPRR